MKREHQLRERQISESITNRNLWLGAIALVLIFAELAGLRAILGTIEAAALRPGALPLVLVAMAVYFALCHLATWCLRGLQRHDIMATARHMSLAELSLYIDRLIAIRDALQEEDVPEVAVRRLPEKIAR